MRKKTKGVILIIIGFFLSFVFSISNLFNYVHIGFGISVDPIDYWANWLIIYGWYTIPLAVVGLFLIIYGRRYMTRKQE